MPKTKAQKQQEARWREIRGELLHAFRAGSDDKVRQEYGPWFLDKREKLWTDYLAIPLAWRRTAMDGASVPANLQAMLEQEAIEQQALDLDGATTTVSVQRTRMRL